MTLDQVIVLIVVAGSLGLFVTEAIPLGVTGVSIVAALGLLGVLPPKEALSAFSSPAFLLVGSLYVVSASLIRTGVVGRIDRFFLKRARTEPTLLLLASVGSAAVSSVVNNTSVVVLMLPLLLGAANRIGVAPSRLLMPVCFAATLGGMTTLIGTSTNVLVADLAEEAFEIGFLDFFPVGMCLCGLGLLYLWFVAPHLLPARPTVSSVTRGRAFDYVTELRVRREGPAVGAAPRELARRVDDRIRVLQLVRGEEVIEGGAPEVTLAPGDILVLRGPPDAIVAMQRDFRLSVLEGDGGPASARGTTFAEIVITPASALLGRTLAQVGLRRTFGVVALALQRRGAHLRRRIVDVPLEVGDVVLVEGAPESVERLVGHPGLILLTGVEEDVALRRHAPVAVAILATFVALAAFEVVNLSLLSLACACACLLTGCIRIRRAVREVDWNVLGLLAGAVTLGLALQRTGLADRFAELVISPCKGLGPTAVLGATYLVTLVLTEFLSNAACAAIMVPVALSTASELAVSPKPFVFAVAYGATVAFATPIGYQTHALVYGPGAYRFTDFLRVGLPLDILCWILATLLIPVFFPF